MATSGQDLDFGTVRNELDTLFAAVANKIEREWPAKWATCSYASLFLRMTVRVSDNTYRTVRYICAEKPPDPARKLEYALSVTPLARTILDSLFNVVFLSVDLPARMKWFLKSGWRELCEEQQRYQSTYGGDLEWADWLDKNGNLVEDLRKQWSITSKEAAQPDLIKWWPNPGQMIRSGSLDAKSRDYLQYLNDWFYRQLSSWSHLSVPGLMVRGAPFVYDSTEREERDRRLDKYRSDCFVKTIILSVALLSEINILLSFDVGSRCRYLWTMLGDYFDAADKLYLRRYASLL